MSSCNDSQKSRSKKIIIPKGSICPNETVVIEIPSRLRNNSVVLAKRRSNSVPCPGAYDTRPHLPLRAVTPLVNMQRGSPRSLPPPRLEAEPSARNPNATVGRYARSPAASCANTCPARAPAANATYVPDVSSPLIRRREKPDVSFRPQYGSTPIKQRECRPCGGRNASAPVNPVASPQSVDGRWNERNQSCSGNFQLYQSPGHVSVGMRLSPISRNLTPRSTESSSLSEVNMDEFTESSGEMNTELLGKVIGGEMGRVLVWPTPPGGGSPRRMIIQPNFSGNMNQPNLPCIANQPNLTSNANQPLLTCNTNQPNATYNPNITYNPNLMYNPNLTYNQPNATYNANKPNVTYNANQPNVTYNANQPNVTYNDNQPNVTCNANQPNVTYNANQPNVTYNANQPNVTCNANRPNVTYNANQPNATYGNQPILSYNANVTYKGSSSKCNGPCAQADNDLTGEQPAHNITYTASPMTRPKENPNMSFRPQFVSTPARGETYAGYLSMGAPMSPMERQSMYDQIANSSSIESFNEEIIEEFDSAEGDDSSGEMDTELLGKVVGGEVGRVLVWPTPPGGGSPRRMVIQPNMSCNANQPNVTCNANPPNEANRTYTATPLNNFNSLPCSDSASSMSRGTRIHECGEQLYDSFEGGIDNSLLGKVRAGDIGRPLAGSTPTSGRATKPPCSCGESQSYIKNVQYVPGKTGNTCNVSTESSFNNGVPLASSTGVESSFDNFCPSVNSIEGGESSGKTYRKTSKRRTRAVLIPQGNISSESKRSTRSCKKNESTNQDADVQQLEQMEAAENNILQTNLRNWQEARRRLILDTTILTSSSTSTNNDGNCGC